MTQAVIIALAFVGACVGSPVVIAWLGQRGVVDIPNARSSHDVPTPRGVGIAVALSVGGAGTLAAFTQRGGSQIAIVTMMATMCAMLGLVEDIRGVTSKWRLMLQCLLAASAVAAVFAIPATIGGWVFVAIACVGVVAYVNAVNFMDGINGISASHGIVVGAMWIVQAWGQHQPGFVGVSALVIAGCVGFLPWNFPNAKGFLGDVGSYFLGGWLATAALVGIASHVAVVGVLAPLSLYFLDTGLTIVVRMSRHESLMTAHRDHVYQRLVRLGWSHARSTALVAALTAAISASAALRSISGFAIAGSLMALYIAAPALVRLRLDTSTIVALVPLREGEHEERAA